MNQTRDFRRDASKTCRAGRSRAVLLAAGLLALLAPAGCGTREPAAPERPKALVLPDTAYRAELTPVNPPTSGTPGSKTTMTVNVKNLGDAAWPRHHEGFALNLTYHWKDRSGGTVVFDGERTAIPVPLAPGAAAPIQATILFPPKAGDYVLELDMVQDYVTWFADKGSKTVKLGIHVE